MNVYINIYPYVCIQYVYVCTCMYICSLFVFSSAVRWVLRTTVLMTSYYHTATMALMPLVAIYLFQPFITILTSNYDLTPNFRITGSMYFCDSSGMTLDWHTKSIRMTLWTFTPRCWTPFGNLTCSLQMKREQTSTRSQRTTNCFEYSRMEMSSTASGDFLL